MAVVRVKRRNDEEPLDILLLSCKRIKTESIPETSVFKFAATVNDQEDSSLHFTHPFKSDAESIIKREDRKFEEIKKKLRVERELLSKNSRYKVVNCYRSLNDDDIKSETESDGVISKKGLTVLDVESHESKSTDLKHTAPNPGSNYVYDLYYAADNAHDLNDLQLEHVQSVHPFETELMFDSYRGGNESDENCDDEDDSNDENNWRNDYPDEDEILSDDNCYGDDDEDGRQLAARMRDLMFGDEEEEDAECLSSDDDGGHVYNNSLNPDDVCNFGEKYAKYKVKVNRNEYDSSCSVVSDDSS